MEIWHIKQQQQFQCLHAYYPRLSPFKQCTWCGFTIHSSHWICIRLILKPCHIIASGYSYMRRCVCALVCVWACNLCAMHSHCYCWCEFTCFRLLISHFVFRLKYQLHISFNRLFFSYYYYYLNFMQCALS